MLLLQLNLILIFLVLKIASKNYFCDFECGNAHSICTRPFCEAGENCGSKFQMLPLNDEDRSMMLALFNERRNYIASGNETRYGQGKASNMNALSYSKELEFVAQCWANDCKIEFESCCVTKKFPKSCGQMLVSSVIGSDADLTSHSFLNSSFLLWYNNIEQMNSQLIDSVPSNFTSSFSMLTAKATHIGCGRVTYQYSTNKRFLLACKYGPALHQGEPLYSRGQPCSKCPNGCNKNYKALCGEIEDFTKDTWTHPFGNWIAIKENKNCKETNASRQNSTDWDNKITRILDGIDQNMKLKDGNVNEMNKRIINLENILIEQAHDYNHQQEKYQIEHTQQINYLNSRLSDIEILLKQILQTSSLKNSSNV